MNINDKNKEQIKLLIEEALYDFAAYLTTRKKIITMSSRHDASDAANALKTFLEKRGLFKEDSDIMRQGCSNRWFAILKRKQKAKKLDRLKI